MYKNVFECGRGLGGGGVGGCGRWIMDVSLMDVCAHLQLCNSLMMN